MTRLFGALKRVDRAFFGWGRLVLWFFVLSTSDNSAEKGKIHVNNAVFSTILTTNCLVTNLLNCLRQLKGFLNHQLDITVATAARKRSWAVGLHSVGYQHSTASPIKSQNCILFQTCVSKRCQGCCPVSKFNSTRATCHGTDQRLVTHWKWATFALSIQKEKL